MEFLLTLALTFVAVILLRSALKRFPVVFYLAAAVLVVLFFAGQNGLLPDTWWKLLVFPVQRCMIALSLFTIVMFIGVLPKGGKLDLWLRPVRGELSIAACILCLGHMCMYLAPYAYRAVSGTLRPMTMTSFVIAILLFALLSVLCVTSFNFVKHRMRVTAWKRVQRLAYPFFGLVWLHLIFMLAPAAAKGGEQALASVFAYSVVFAAYFALRIARRLREPDATRGAA